MENCDYKMWFVCLVIWKQLGGGLAWFCLSLIIVFMLNFIYILLYTNSQNLVKKGSFNEKLRLYKEIMS